MAYAIKYLFKFESSNGTTREIRVLQDGYSGDVIQRPLGRAPILKKQQNGPVHGTSLEFYAECNVDREFIEFYTSDPKAYRVDLYAGATLLWQGYITPELYSEPDIAPPYDVQVVATDGVGELKLYNYAAQGTVTLRTLLSGLLSRTGLGTDIYLISSLKPGSAGAGSLLEKTINLDYLAGNSCYEVLTYILDTLHATITWWKGAWILTRETNVTFTNGKVRYFNTAGNSALLNDSVQVLGKMYANPAWPVGQLSTVIDPAKNRVAVQAPWHVVTCLRNPDMGFDADWTKAKNARYETDGYVLPININTGTSETAVISQATSMAGLRVPMNLSVKATGATSEISAQVTGAVLGVLLTYKVGNVTYHLVKGDDGVPVWQQGDDIGTYIPLRTRIDFQQQLATWDSSRIEAEELTIDNIPPFLQGTTFPAGTLTVYILGYCAKIYGTYLDVVLPKGYQDILRIDNGARGEGNEVEIAIGRETTDNAYYAAFLQGLLLDSGNLITSFSDANFPGGMDYLAFIARDYALSVALPRAKVTGAVYLESDIAAPPLVFTKGALNYWLQTWSWNLYEDELEIEGLTLPSASLTVESETILESTASASSSTGRTSGGGSIAPGVSMAAVQEWVTGQGYLASVEAASTYATITALNGVSGRVTTLEGRTNWDTYFGVDENGDIYVKKNGTTARNFYSWGAVSAGGLSSGGGSEGASLAAVWASLRGNSDDYANEKINAYHIPIGSGLSVVNGLIVANNAGTVTSVKVGTTTYNPTDGVVSLPAYPTSLPASDVYSWAKAETKPSYAFSEITGTASTSQIPTLAISKISGLQTALDGKQPLDADLTAIAGLTGTSGFLKKTAANTWALDTNTYLTGITSTMVTNALGYTPWHASNHPTTLSGYGITDSVEFDQDILDLGATHKMGYGYTAHGWPYSGPAMTFGSGEYTAQIQSSASGNHLYYRQTVNGTAQSWVEIYHTGNLTKSVITGLLEDNNGYYVKKSGDTMTGALTVSAQVIPVSMEFRNMSSSAGNGGYIDFHFNNSSADFTTRIIESASGILSISGGLSLGTTLQLGDGVLSWDGSANAWKLTGNFYATGFISAGGVSSGGGTAGVDLTAVWNNFIANTGEGLNKKIHTAHLPTVTVTGTNISGTGTYSGTGGSASTLTLSLTAVDTTYSAGTGISLSGTTFSNSGVRSATINGNYLRVNTNGTNADLTIPFSTKAGYISTFPQINTESSISTSGLHIYQGVGGDWTGSVTSMAYAAILALGDPSRGWQLWAQRGNSSLIWRNGKDDISGWNTERTLLDSANYTSYVNTTNFPGLNGNQAITLSGDVSGSGATSISVSIGQGKVTNAMLAGSIANGKLANSAITINGSSASLGGSFSTASITAGTAGQSTASSGVSFSIPYVTMNAYGIVTGYGTHTHTISASDLTTTIGSTTYAPYNSAGYLPLTGGTIQSASTSYSRLRLVTTSGEAYVQAGTGNENAGTLYLSGYNAASGASLYLKFSNVYAYNGSAFSQILHAGNYSSYVLPLTGGTMSGNITMGTNAVVFNQSQSSSWENPKNSGLRILNALGTAVTGAPRTYVVGLSVSGYYGFQLASFGGEIDAFYIRSTTDGSAARDWRTIWHSGNSNLSTVPWACSTLTASGTIVSSANPGFRVNATANATAIAAYVNGNRKWQIDTIDGDARWYSDGAGAYVLNIATNGNIGIDTGTTTPGYKLDVNGSIGCSTLTTSGQITATGTWASGTAGVKITNNTTANIPWLFNSLAPNMSTGTYSAIVHGVANSNYNAASLSFYYAGAGSTANYTGLGLYGHDNLLIVRGDGRVGMGTTSPEAALHVHTASYPTILLDSTTTESSIYYRNSTGVYWAAGAGCWGSQTGTTSFVVGVYSGTGSSAWKAFITNTGDLTVANSITSSAVYLQRVSGTTAGRISFYSKSYYTWYEYMSPNGVASPTGANTQVGTYVTSWARRSLIENISGYGWIWESCANSANATPAIKMELSSNTGNLRIGGSFVAVGAVTAGSASDARLKTNIQSLSADAAKRIVMALNPVTFTWNEKATELYDQYKGDDLGMIAQEVEPYLPQAVGTIFENYKRLDYTKVISPLVKVAQDHESRIRQLEARVAELEMENERLRS